MFGLDDECIIVVGRIKFLGVLYELQIKERLIVFFDNLFDCLFVIVFFCLLRILIEFDLLKLKFSFWIIEFNIVVIKVMSVIIIFVF